MRLEVPNLGAESKHRLEQLVAEVLVLVGAVILFVAILFGEQMMMMMMRSVEGKVLNRVNPAGLAEDSASNRSVRRAALFYFL